MNSESELTFKEKLAARLMNFPLLRQLLFEFWFRLVFILFLLGVILLALVLPKIWTVSPRDFKPVIKISGLDVLQAWALRRTALKTAAAGKNQEASYAWRAAIANNPADPNLYRGALWHDLQTEGPSQTQLAEAVGKASVLLRLTKTNEVDLLLAARVYEKYQLYDWVLELLRPFQDRLHAPLDAAYLRALFHMEQMDQFAQLWERMDPRSRTIPELGLYHTAFLAGWGPPDTAGEAKQELEKATLVPEVVLVANRLQMTVSARLGDIEGFRRALDRLEQRQQETLLDRLGYWQLLVSVGRKEEARELAQTYAYPPASPLEVIRLASIYAALGMRDYAVKFLDRSLAEFGYAPQVWLLYANLLVEDKHWEELRNLALKIRQQPRVQDILAGYSYFLEGRAELAQDRVTLAAEAFQKASRFPFELGTLGLSTANKLAQLGYPAEARDILLKLEKNFENNANYWNALCLAGYGVKQPDLMLKAAQRAFEIQPANEAFANNYAAALLYNRERPEEAVKLTLQVIAQSPASRGAKINHVLALLLSGRIEDAETLLKTLDRENLSPQEMAGVDLAWFEIFYHRKQYARAQKVNARLHREYLFPTQIKWLDKTLKEMESLNQSKADYSSWRALASHAPRNYDRSRCL